MPNNFLLTKKHLHKRNYLRTACHTKNELSTGAQVAEIRLYGSLLRSHSPFPFLPCANLTVSLFHYNGYQCGRISPVIMTSGLKLVLLQSL